MGGAGDAGRWLIASVLVRFREKCGEEMSFRIGADEASPSNAFALSAFFQSHTL